MPSLDYFFYTPCRMRFIILEADRAVARALIGGGGGGVHSYIRDLPD